jgi:NTE family protein
VTAEPPAPKLVNLALQGGGSHGAFTWGVLERLAEDGRLRIDGISGTSAGAVNGAVFAHGLMQGGAAGASAALETFWLEVSRAGWFNPWFPTLYNYATGTWNIDWSPFPLGFDLLSQFLSPYQLNPLGKSALRDILEDQIDFARLHCCQEVKLFVAATNVRTNKLRVFSVEELTLEAVLASATLPQLSHAVEIDGDPYWDGGYMGNPALFPLIRSCAARDIVIVQINPTRRAGVPTTSPEIADRLNEITFNASLMREMLAINTITKLIERGAITDQRYDRVRFHLIEAEELMAELGVNSKLSTDRRFLEYLRDVGRQRAARWLDENFDRIGVETSFDLEERFP